ncbi:hypothetical protein [Micromonospora sp. CPCC 206061]|uniref:hypothetical protein n=1 Tax=Micromonospora sp. CPCC 206061 TaxID=3122410 RepID=UPI002FEF3BBC
MTPGPDEHQPERHWRLPGQYGAAHYAPPATGALRHALATVLFAAGRVHLGRRHGYARTGDRVELNLVPAHGVREVIQMAE